MGKWRSWMWLGLMGLMGCRPVDAPCLQPVASDALLQVPDGFPEMPFPADNALTEARWRLGKKLFYDPVLSITGTHSCGSCHKTEFALADHLPTSPGVLDRPGTRNAPSLANVGYQPYYIREGGVPTLEMQVLVPIQESNEFAHNIVDIAAVLAQDSAYLRMSLEAYGRTPDPYVITRAIATFERTMISGQSPYDLHKNGCNESLSDAALRGMDLFFSDRTSCSSCHGGFNFTTYAFENNGLYLNYADPGRYRLTLDSADLARFKVPSLRNAAYTAPYMHDGSLATLTDVVAHYNAGGAAHRNKSPLVRPLRLSEAEQRDLVSFLHALSDENFVNDPRWRKD